MQQSACINWDAKGADQIAFIKSLLQNNQLYSDQFTILPPMPKKDLAREMANTDCGLFPNRCEGGTNLVLMEYAATGHEVIANTLTGHADVEAAISTEIKAREDENHWAVCEIDAIARALETAYQYPIKPWRDIRQWTWAKSADTIMNALSNVEVPA